MLWDTVMSRRDAYHAVCVPPLSRIALKADVLRSKSPNEPYLFRSKAQVRRHSGSISRACNAAQEQIRPVPTGVLSAAVPLDLFRFGVVKMLERRFRRRLRFSLSQKRKISISKLQVSKKDVGEQRLFWTTVFLFGGSIAIKIFKGNRRGSVFFASDGKRLPFALTKISRCNFYGRVVQ